MKVIEVTYGRTFNLGNFESLRLEMKASIEEGEDPKVVAGQLAAEVAAYKQKGGK
jgi:hypothetical protein